MKVIWLPQARKEVRRIGNYIRRQFGQLSYEKFKQEIREISHLLGTNPNIGIVEPLLVERTVKYHSLVMNELNKIIYFIKDDHIEVADFWDVRREPSKLAARVK